MRYEYATAVVTEKKTQLLLDDFFYKSKLRMILARKFKIKTIHQSNQNNTLKTYFEFI
jgi:hypothetical protein